MIMVNRTISIEEEGAGRGLPVLCVCVCVCAHIYGCTQPGFGTHPYGCPLSTWLAEGTCAGRRSRKHWWGG
ncbi:hypothetical protein AB205_0028150 [Aquarana catesbeiana]|uniref:Uncharacterized protein n=1 Tax=Aquarana catesbeiana TaxID=8400 RepID=A0A2G9SLW5_AQUCT|nr:hypothetical protein AB205_0028150 [Aquarana catesbeiana]